MSYLKVIDFYKNFFRVNGIPSIYNAIYYTHNKSTTFHKPNYNSNSSSLNPVNLITLFPKYLNFNIDTSIFKIKETEQVKLPGFGILIDNEKDIESYLINNFKSSTRSPIKRKLKRLENCFTIKREFYFGDNISKDKCDHLMQALKHMLTVRFAQKKEPNEVLGKWDSYCTNTYKQIINKEASIFAIYANNNIIAISLNYHAKDVLIGHIIGSDIDYYKFSIGNAIVYGLLDWAIKNNYKILDMGNGETEYKNIWSNFSYHYSYHFIYKKKSIKARVIANFLMLKIRAKNMLKILKFDHYYKSIKNILFSNKIEEINTYNPYQIKDLPIDAFKSMDLVKINFIDNIYMNLKHIIYNFLYLYKEHINNIEVYTTTNNQYIIKGKEHIVQVETNNHSIN